MINLEHIGQPAKRHRTGRKFEGDLSKRTNKGAYLTISFPRGDLAIYDVMVELVKKGTGSFSELARVAFWHTYGGKLLDSTKQMILDRYANRELEGPKLFKEFEDVLLWEVQHRTFTEIKDLWRISGHDLGVLLLEIAMEIDS